MPSMTSEKVHQQKVRQEKGEHKSEFHVENKGNKSHSQAGAHTERGRGDKYVHTGMTDGMHGQSTGGHPTHRATEFSDKGKGHHIK